MDVDTEIKQMTKTVSPAGGREVAKQPGHITTSPVGILLTNLGTPNSPTYLGVANYLREFLNDARVITLPAALRWALLNLVIIPLRTKKSVHAYRSIWQQDGSPLLTNSQRYCAKIATGLGANYRVALGMRYGEPSLEQAIKSLLGIGCRKIILMPMFPQYARATTGSVTAKVLQLLAKEPDQIPLEVRAPFFDHPEYINALSALIAENLQNSSAEYLLLSYHGLPERQVNCTQLSACYEVDGSCVSPQCYRAQCYKTARLVANSLGLADNQYGVSFQSRLGVLPWIKPYTDEFLATLIKRGVTNLAVACPSFVVDCLETLEEVGVRLKQQWQNLGGKSFQLIPCLNDQSLWVNAMVKMLKG